MSELHPWASSAKFSELRRPRFWIAALILIVFDLILTSQLAQAAQDSSETALKLREALVEFQKKTPLESWQSKIFEEEVLPQAQRFVRDYRPTAQGLSVDIDQDSLSKYLQFYGLKSLKTRDFKIFSTLVIDPSCPACVRAAPELKAQATARLERRGLSPVWTEVVPIAGRRMADKAFEAARGKGAAGALVVQAIRAPADDEDAAHADELRYWVLTDLMIGELGVKNSGKLELMANDALEPAMTRLLTDAFTEVGARVQIAAAAAVMGNMTGVVLEVSQFKDYASYREIVDKLSTQLKDVQSLDEKKMTRGRVTLVAQTSRSASDLKRQVEGLGLKAFVEVKQQ